MGFECRQIIIIQSRNNKMRKEIEETKENNLKKLKNSLPKVIKGKI